MSSPTVTPAALDLLVLISRAGEAGALVYGRGPAAQAENLTRRGYLYGADLVKVVSMGSLVTRYLYRVTPRGVQTAVDWVNRQAREVRGAK